MGMAKRQPKSQDGAAAPGANRDDLNFPKEKPAFSTAVSDVVLCSTSLILARQLQTISTLATFGYLAIGIAAFFGILRFGGMNVGGLVPQIHDILSSYAGNVGLPCINASFGFVSLMPSEMENELFTCIVLLLSVLHLVCIHGLKLKLYDPLPGAVSMIFIILVGIQGNVLAIIAQGLVLISVAILEKRIFLFSRMPPEDSFHYLFSAGLYMLAQSRLFEHVEALS